jgi:hypothetical protein
VTEGIWVYWRGEKKSPFMRPSGCGNRAPGRPARRYPTRAISSNGSSEATPQHE